MKNLLYKELKLALQAPAVLFLALSAMLLIPNYPYYVTFFYSTLGIFFCCQLGRENKDIFFTLCLPVRKRDVVSARFLLAVLLEAAQIDGCGRFRQAWHVTLPGIKSTFVVLLIMNIGHLMEAGFELQYLMGNPQVYDYSRTIDVFVMEYGISNGKFGRAIAAGSHSPAVDQFFPVV